MKKDFRSRASNVLGKALLAALCFFVVVSPFSKMLSKTAQFSAIGLWITMVAFGGVSLNLLRSRVSVMVLLFFTAAVISTIFSSNPYHSQQILFQRYSIYLLFYAIGFTLCGGSTTRLYPIANALLAMGFFIGAGAVADFIRFRPYRLFTVFGKGIYMSAFLPFVLPFSYIVLFFERHRWFRIFGLVNAALLLPVFIWHGSRGVWIAIFFTFAASFVFFYTSRSYRIGLSLGAVVVVLSLLSAPAYILPRVRLAMDCLTETSLGDRVNLMETAVSIYKAHPVKGAGLGMFEFLYTPPKGYEEFQSYIHSHAHNNYLEVAAEMGSLGLVPFCAIFVTFCVIAYRRLRRRIGVNPGITAGLAIAIFAVILLCLSGSFITVGVQAAVLFWFLLGISADLLSTEYPVNDTAAKEA